MDTMSNTIRTANTKTKVLSAFVALVAGVMIAQFAFATPAYAVEKYNMWIAGTQVTSENCYDLTIIDGVSADGEGYVEFDPKTNTLSLKDATVVNKGGNPESNTAVTNYVAPEKGFTIVVEGNCKLTGASGDTTQGMYYGGECTISLVDDAKLEVHPGSYEGAFSTGIAGDGLVLEGSGFVYAYAQSGENSCAVRQWGRLWIRENTNLITKCESGDTPQNEMGCALYGKNCVIAPEVDGYAIFAGEEYGLLLNAEGESECNLDLTSVTYDWEGAIKASGGLGAIVCLTNDNAKVLLNDDVQLIIQSGERKGEKITTNGYKLSNISDCTEVHIVSQGNPEPIPGEKVSLKDAKLTVKDQTYTGSALTPAVEVVVDSKTLKADTDYKVEYADNVEIGTATVTVTGKGNYVDSATTTFKILRPPAPAMWKRLAGKGALDTMSAIIDEGSFTVGGTVVLASLEGYWDALTAAGIAGLEDAPVIMALQDSLGDRSAAQIKKLKPARIIVCGGTYWIPDKVVDEAKDAAGTNPEVVRLAGDNAALTAGQIAAAGKGKWGNTAIVATAGTFQDALAAAPVAYANAMPIFLTQFDFAAEKGYITEDTIKAMKDVDIVQCYIAGGTYWIPEQVTKDLEAAGIKVISQIMGENAVATSVDIGEMAIVEYGMHADDMGAADMRAHYDALASAAFCGKRGSVLVLVTDEKIGFATAFAKGHAKQIWNGYVFGGTSSVSDESMKALEDATK